MVRIELHLVVLAFADGKYILKIFPRIDFRTKNRFKKKNNSENRLGSSLLHILRVNPLNIMDISVEDSVDYLLFLEKSPTTERLNGGPPNTPEDLKQYEARWYGFLSLSGLLGSMFRNMTELAKAVKYLDSYWQTEDPYFAHSKEAGEIPIACAMLAGKLEGSEFPLEVYVRLFPGTTGKNLKYAERLVLQVIEWRLQVTTASGLVETVLECGLGSTLPPFRYRKMERQLLLVMEHKRAFARFPESIIAAAILQPMRDLAGAQRLYARLWGQQEAIEQCLACLRSVEYWSSKPSYYLSIHRVLA